MSKQPWYQKKKSGSQGADMGFAEAAEAAPAADRWPQAESATARLFLPPAAAGRDAGDSYEVLGDSDQLLYIELAPGASVLASPGAMMMMSNNIQTSVSYDSMGVRCCSGESCCLARFTNTGNLESHLSLTAKAPSVVLPLKLQRDAGAMQLRRGSYFASRGDVDIGFECDCNPLTSCCAGFGCVRQTLAGDGTAFLAATGTVTTKTLADGEMLVVDSTSLMAWESSARLGVRPAGGCCVCCLSGEGCCNTTITGPGTVYLQSMTFTRMHNALSFTVYKKSRAGAGGGQGSAD